MSAALAHLLDLALAYLLALPIGWERERAERSADIRTFALVAIASCLFVLATENAVRISLRRGLASSKA